MVTTRTSADAAENLNRPLVLDRAKRRLYLARYWHFQQRLAKSLVERLRLAPLAMKEDRLAADIARLFPDRGTPGGFDQCVAVANAVDQRLSVITGGPGTGKTTTVAKLLALRFLQQPAVDAPLQPLKVLLMAPTGKAAQRLNESLGRATRQLPVEEAIRAALEKVRAGTIHRILEWTPIPPERGGPFRYNSEFPLDADVVVVDEASMVDIGLMWRLFDAAGPDAQVILIGDRDQLASIEAGGVLSDLCGGPSSGALHDLTQARCRIVAQRTGLNLPSDGSPVEDVLANNVVNLRYSHRFEPSSHLGRLAAGIRAGDAKTVCGELRAASPEQIRWIEPVQAAKALAEVVDQAAEYYAEYLTLLAASPSGSIQVIKTLNRFRVLCAHREGRWGESNFNRLIAERLSERGLLQIRRGSYFGQPVMVIKNDYRQQLFNGDVGVAVRDSTGDGLAVLFEEPAAEGGCRIVPAALVPETRTCFAITIHKSQGSEFHRVMVVLPDRPSPVLTRELLYTAATRVCDEIEAGSGHRRPGKLYLLATESVVRRAVECRIRRTSGLRDAIAAMHELSP
jgi:exodeoxyribonuclease V alpha subunit